MAIKLIIGLGNPGTDYDATRHNAGNWFVQALAKKENALFTTEKKVQAMVANIHTYAKPYKIALSNTFMNQSGLCIGLFNKFYQILPDEMVIVHDELDLPVGTIKLKTGGGHGGHNGLRDIIDCLHTQMFHRLRIGIGHPGHKDKVFNYVLGSPNAQDRQQIHDAIDNAIMIIPDVIAGNLSKVMTILHR